MDLNAVRERINAIDDQIVDLFVERMKASADVASAKGGKEICPFWIYAESRRFWKR